MLNWRLNTVILAADRQAIVKVLADIFYKEKGFNQIHIDIDMVPRY